MWLIRLLKSFMRSRGRAGRSRVDMSVFEGDEEKCEERCLVG